MRSCHKHIGRVWNFPSIYYSFEVMRHLNFHLHLICIFFKGLTIPSQVHTFTHRAITMPNLVVLGIIVSEKNSGQDLVVKKERKKELEKKICFTANLSVCVQRRTVG